METGRFELPSTANASFHAIDSFRSVLSRREIPIALAVSSGQALSEMLRPHIEAGWFRWGVSDIRLLPSS